MRYQIKLFQTARGDYPVNKFVEEQDPTTYSKILHTIGLLKNHGYYLRMPFSKKLGDKLYELRITSKVAARILYTTHNSVFYLLHAFKKKAQKTPRKEIKIALDRIKKIV